MITFIITGILLILLLGVIVIVGVFAPTLLIGFLLIGPFVLLDIFAIRALFRRKK